MRHYRYPPGRCTRNLIRISLLHAVNLRPIHDYYASSLSSKGDHKSLNVYFRYYREVGDKVELYKTMQFYPMQIVKE